MKSNSTSWNIAWPNYSRNHGTKEKGARELTLREALVVTTGYIRQNITEEIWADISDVDQSTISRYITFLTPFVEKATEENRPTAEDAAEATRDAIILVDATLWPCWSWDGEDELWAGKMHDHGPRLPPGRQPGDVTPRTRTP